MGPTTPGRLDVGEDTTRVLADGLLQRARPSRTLARHTGKHSQNVGTRFSTVLAAYVNGKGRTLLHPPTFHPFRGSWVCALRTPKWCRSPFLVRYGQFGRRGTRVGPTGLEWVLAKTLVVRFHLLRVIAFIVALGF